MIEVAGHRARICVSGVSYLVSNTFGRFWYSPENEIINTIMEVYINDWGET